ncbi:MAG: hypothetical protein ACJASQ_003731 [Crocinitomicaceae bacterium]|jgi:hypothetical protein
MNQIALISDRYFPNGMKKFPNEMESGLNIHGMVGAMVALQRSFVVLSRLKYENGFSFDNLELTRVALLLLI